MDAIELSLEWFKDMIEAAAVLSIVTVVFAVVFVAEIAVIIYLAATSPRD